jgi:hypothetical protein
MFSTPSSIMSRTRPSNIRVKIKSFGRFFECRPVTNRLASFFCAKNSNEEGESNGWISFFLEKFIACGRFNAYFHQQKLFII